jgi:hypothetical protein
MAAALDDERVADGSQQARIEEWLGRTHLARGADGAGD